MEKTTTKNRRVITGIVVSDKMDKTGVAKVTYQVKHPLYGKIVKKSKKFKFHDAKNECGIGDTVQIVETKHMSKDKYFKLVKIVEKAK